MMDRQRNSDTRQFAAQGSLLGNDFHWTNNVTCQSLKSNVKLSMMHSLAELPKTHHCSLLVTSLPSLLCVSDWSAKQFLAKVQQFLMESDHFQMLAGGMRLTPPPEPISF